MFGSLTEFNYLSAQKVRVYRRVMRFFLDQHLVQRSTIPPEDVLEMLVSSGEVHGYDLEQMILDLESLVSWGNLGRRRDPRRVSTLKEYARRRDLYFATARGLAIEGFLQNGLDAGEDAVMVAPNVLAGLEERLRLLEELLESGVAEDEVELLWFEAHRAFVDVSGDVRGLASNLERRLLLEEREVFLEFKDVVRGFVERLSKELSGAGRRVRARLLEFDRAGLARADRLAEVVGRVRSGRLTVSAGVVSASDASRRARREFEAMRDWFTRTEAEGDGLEYAIFALRGAVARVLAYVDAVHRTRELGLGRAGEFVQLAERLMGFEDMLFARFELAQFLRLTAPLHASGDAPLERAGAAWLEPLEPVELHPVQRGRAANRATASVGETSREARAAASQARKGYRDRQKHLLELFRAAGGELRLDGLNLPDLESLHEVLGYLERAWDGVSAGPDGHLLEVALEDAPATISGQDWILHLERGARLRLLEAS